MILEPVLREQHRLSSDEAKRKYPLSPVSIAERHKSKLCRRVHDQILRHSADVRHSQAGPHHELYDEITIPDTPQAVLRDRLEA